VKFRAGFNIRSRTRIARLRFEYRYHPGEHSIECRYHPIDGIDTRLGGGVDASSHGIELLVHTRLKVSDDSSDVLRAGHYDNCGCTFMLHMLSAVCACSVCDVAGIFVNYTTLI
jgi:hypothetical protein